MSDAKFEFNDKGLDKIKKNLKKSPYVKLGILSNTNARPDEGESNASIGLQHEFGSISKGIPARSFLRMPIETKGKQLAKDMLSFKKKLEKSLPKDGFLLFLDRLGKKGEAIVQEAFASKGFGKWQANSPETIAMKGSTAPLIDTGELRKSITSKVING